MGAKVSKPAQAATRKFPSRAPGAAVPPTSRPPPAASRPAQRAAPPKSEAQASFIKSEAIQADGLDPDSVGASTSDFSRRLHQMGVVTPNPTYSSSSIAGDRLSPSSPTARTAPPFSEPQKHQHASPASPAPPSPGPAATTSTSTSATTSQGASAAAMPTRPPLYPDPSRNPTLTALEARRRIQQAADAQFEDPRIVAGGQGPGAGGREFLDVGTLRQILMFRSMGQDPKEIEKRLRLKEGVVARLGAQGVFVPIG